MGFSRCALAFFAVSFGIGAIVACSEPPGVDACRAIEDARCKYAPNCPDINLSTPVHRNGMDIDACIEYYEDACKHGLASGADPSGSQINACVASLTTCDYVESPEDSPACSFLIPPATATDSGADGEASASDGSVDASVDSAADGSPTITN